LTVIHIPAAVEVICARCFCSCKSLASATFAVDCKLSRLERYAFSESGLTVIHIPPCAEVICARSFSPANPLYLSHSLLIANCHDSSRVSFMRVV
jgi:hypothetical protein